MTGPVPLDPPGAAYPGMSQGIRVGDWIILSGQVALAGGNVVGEGDAAAQARQCFANIAAVLKEGGAGLEDIVRLRCFLTDPAAFAGYSKVKGELLAATAPASTTVIVAGLLIPGLVMEIEAVAYKPASA